MGNQVTRNTDNQKQGKFGIVRKVGNIILPFSTAKAMVRSVGYTARSVKNTASIIYDLASGTKDRYSQEKVEEILNDEEQSKKHYRQNKIAFFAYMGGVILSSIFCVFYSLNGMALSGALALGTTLYFAPYCMGTSIACASIKQKRPVGVKEWLESHTLWIPWKLMLAVGFCALSYPAYAETREMAELLEYTSEGDLAAAHLDQLFGYIVEGKHQDTALGKMLYEYNGWVLAAASAFLGFGVIVAIVDAAREGKVLGGGYNSSWAPLRVVLGMFLLMPLPATHTNQDGSQVTVEGVNVVQGLVMKVATYGVGFGNLIWNQVIDFAIYEGKNIIPPTVNTNSDIIYGFLKAEVCANLRDITEYLWMRDTGIQLGKDYLPEGVERSVQLPKIYTEVDSIIPAEWQIGDTVTYKVTWDYGKLCGKITDTIDIEMREGVGKVFHGVNKVKLEAMNYIGIGGGYFVDEAQSGLPLKSGGVLKPIHDTAINMAQTLHPEGMYYNRDLTDKERIDGYSVKYFTDIAEQFQQSVQQSMAKMSDQLVSVEEKAFAEDAKRSGFLAAGAYFNKLASINAKMVNASNIEMVYSGAHFEHKRRLTDIESLAGGLNMLSEWWETRMPKRVGYQTTQYQVTTLKQGLNIKSIKELKDEYEDFDIGSLTSFTFVPRLMMIDGLNPLAQISNIGHYMLDAAWMAIVTRIFIESMVAGVHDFFDASLLPGSSVGAGLSGFTLILVRGFQGIVLPMFFTIMMAGSFLAYYLPMIPYVIWMFAVISWFAFIIEAIVASPFWAMAHVRVSGGGVFGDAAILGYQFLINLFIRPALMVIGLVFGFAMLFLGVSIMNNTFIYAIETTNDESIKGVVAAVFYSIMIVVLYLRIVDLSFSFIPELPNRITDWIGFRIRGIADGKDQSEKTQILTGLAVSHPSKAFAEKVSTLQTNNKTKEDNYNVKDR